MAALVGTVGAVNYGALAYVGLMAVDPMRQGRGIGRLLVERLLHWLDQQGCPVVLLDATDQGARLYETVGFVDDATAYVYERQDTDVAMQCSAPGLPGDLVVRPGTPEELDEIAAFDARRFGADRHRLLAALWELDRERCLVARQSAGELAGYLFVRNGVLGPWVAADPRAADALLTTVLRSRFAKPPGGPLLVLVPRSNHDCAGSAGAP